MEELNINDFKSTAEFRNPLDNEGEYIQICDDFKRRIDEKNKIIYSLKMDLMVSYGLTKTIESCEDILMLELLLDHIEKSCIHHFNIETAI